MFNFKKSPTSELDDHICVKIRLFDNSNKQHYFPISCSEYNEPLTEDTFIRYLAHL